MAYLTDPLYTKFSVDVSITNKSILGKNYCIEEAPKIPLFWIQRESKQYHFCDYSLFLYTVGNGMGRYAMLVTKGDGKRHSNHVLFLFVEKRADFCRLTFCVKNDGLLRTGVAAIFWNENERYGY